MGELYYVRLRFASGSVVQGRFRADSEDQAVALAQAELGAGGVEEVAIGDAALAAERGQLLRDAHQRVDELCREATLGHEAAAETLSQIERALENLRDTTLRDYAQ